MGEQAGSVISKVRWWGEGTTIAAVLTFIAYFFGYLSLRFHLTAMGVEPVLKILDDRYLYAAANFLVFIVPTVTRIGLLLLIMGILVVLPGAFIFVMYRVLPQRVVLKLRALKEAFVAKLKARVFRPAVLSWIGAILAICLVLLFSNVCLSVT